MNANRQILEHSFAALAALLACATGIHFHEEATGTFNWSTGGRLSAAEFAPVPNLVVQGREFGLEPLALFNRDGASGAGKAGASLLDVEFDPQLGLPLFHDEKREQPLQGGERERVADAQPVDRLVPFSLVLAERDGAAEEFLRHQERFDHRVGNAGFKAVIVPGRAAGPEDVDAAFAVEESGQVQQSVFCVHEAFLRGLRRSWVQSVGERPQHVPRVSRTCAVAS